MTDESLSALGTSIQTALNSARAEWSSGWLVEEVLPDDWDTLLRFERACVAILGEYEWCIALALDLTNGPLQAANAWPLIGEAPVSVGARNPNARPVHPQSPRRRPVPSSPVRPPIGGATAVPVESGPRAEAPAVPPSTAHGQPLPGGANSRRPSAEKVPLSPDPEFGASPPPLPRPAAEGVSAGARTHPPSASSPSARRSLVDDVSVAGRGRSAAETAVGNHSPRQESDPWDAEAEGKRTPPTGFAGRQPPLQSSKQEVVTVTGRLHVGNDPLRSAGRRMVRRESMSPRQVTSPQASETGRSVATDRPRFADDLGTPIELKTDRLGSTIRPSPQTEEIGASAAGARSLKKTGGAESAPPSSRGPSTDRAEVPDRVSSTPDSEVEGDSVTIRPRAEAAPSASRGVNTHRPEITNRDSEDEVAAAVESMTRPFPVKRLTDLALALRSNPMGEGDDDRAPLADRDAPTPIAPPFRRRRVPKQGPEPTDNPIRKLNLPDGGSVANPATGPGLRASVVATTEAAIQAGSDAWPTSGPSRENLEMDAILESFTQSIHSQYRRHYGE